MSNALRILIVFAVALGVAKSAHAQAVINDCGPFFDKLFAEDGFGQGRPPTDLTVVGTRVSARDGSGFHSFSMATNYNTSITLNSQVSSDRSFFKLVPVDRPSNGQRLRYTGAFNDVFPGRQSGDVDRMRLIIYRGGRVDVLLVNLGNAVLNMRGLSCYGSPAVDGEVVMTGYSVEGGSRVNVYSFLLDPTFLF